MSPRHFVLIPALALLLGGCATMTQAPRVDLESSARWALLPLENTSGTPQAGDSARSLLESQLRARGLPELGLYAPPPETTLQAHLNDQQQLTDALAWAKASGYRYGVTGQVQEWRYKNGLDNEPAVGLSLKIVDVQSGKAVWVASASRTGWGYTSLTGVASRTIGDLLAQVSLK